MIRWLILLVIIFCSWVLVFALVAHPVWVIPAFGFGCVWAGSGLHDRFTLWMER